LLSTGDPVFCFKIAVFEAAEGETMALENWMLGSFNSGSICLVLRMRGGTIDTYERIGLLIMGKDDEYDGMFLASTITIV